MLKLGQSSAPVATKAPFLQEEGLSCCFRSPGRVMHPLPFPIRCGMFILDSSHAEDLGWIREPAQAQTLGTDVLLGC